jgi:1-acyl-sn-glycerol-3-phosphate acyltransferase
MKAPMPPEEPGSETGWPDGGEREDVRRALEELRAEVQARLLARRATTPGVGFHWEELFERARRSLSTLGMVERSGEVDEFGMDEVVLRRAGQLFDFLMDSWWRIETIGLDGTAPPAPALLVANASGLLPYDAIMIAHAVARAQPAAPRPRFLVADWLITLPFAQANLARIGGVRACRENAERLLRSGHSVVSFPEGVKGSAKVFRERYRLKRFGRGGVVRVALATGAPLVPVAVIGAEETHPVLFRLTSIAHLAGLPFLPVTPTFPLLGPLGLIPLPSHWQIRIGAPLDLGGFGPDAAEDELLVTRLTQELRERLQAMLSEGVRSRAAVFA